MTKKCNVQYYKAPTTMAYNVPPPPPDENHILISDRSSVLAQITVNIETVYYLRFASLSRSVPDPLDWIRFWILQYIILYKDKDY